MELTDLFSKCDAALIVAPSNRFYFCDVDTSFGAVLLTRQKKYFITDFRYAIAVSDELPDFEVIISKKEQYLAKVASLLEAESAFTVGYEDEYWSIADFKTLKIELKNYELTPIGADLRLLRTVKSEKEIERIGAAQAVTESALTKTLALLKVGVTEREISAELTYRMLMLGADGLAFDNIVAFGENTADCHHKAGNRKLEKNDIVLFDIGAKLNGYCSDMTRTFYFGEVNQRFADLHRLVLSAQTYVLKHIKAGVTGIEADMMAREFFKANGYEKEFGHSLGHGVGIDIHEYPVLGRSNTEPLPENAVVTVEPGLYIEGFGGVRIEDTVVLKKDGIENLTTFSKSYII